MHIGQMHFDKRNIDGSQGIAQCNAGMRIRRSVDNDEISLVLASSLHPIDEFTFVIALKSGQYGAVFCGQLRQMLIDICQGLPTVDIRLTCAEQIQVGAVQNEDVLRHGKFFVKTERLFTLNNGICPLKRSKLNVYLATKSEIICLESARGEALLAPWQLSLCRQGSCLARRA